MRRALFAIAAGALGACAPEPQPAPRLSTSRAALLGPEAPATSERAPGDAEGLRSPPKVVGGTAGALAVWADGRRSWVATPWLSFSTDLYASLIDASGARVDPTGRVLALDVNNEPPAVAFNGSEYLVAYCGAQQRLVPLRLSPLAVPVVAPTPLMVPCDNTPLDASWTGTSWLIVMERKRTAVRVAADGTLLDVAPLTLVPNDGGFSSLSGVASAPSVSLVAVNNNFGAAFVRVDPNGGVLDAPPRILADAGFDLAVTAVDGGFFVAWQTPSQAQGVFINAGGAASAVVALGSPTAGSATALATDSADVVALWPQYSTGYSLLGQRVTPGGAVLDGAGRTLWPNVYNPQAAPLAPGFAVVGTGLNAVLTSSVVLRYGRVAADLSLVDASPRPLATSANAQHQPAVAIAGGVGLVAWQDFRGFGLQAPYAVEVALDGTPLAPAPTALNLGLADGCSAPVLATEDTHVVAICHDYSGPSQGVQRVGVTLTPALAVSPAAAVSNRALPPCNLCPASRPRPAVAVRPESALFAWSEDFPGDTVAAEVLPRDGGPPVRVTLEPYTAFVTPDLVAAPLAGGYLVVWADAAPQNMLGMRFARVSAAGVVLDSPAKQLEVNSANELGVPAIASDGERALVAFETFTVATAYVAAHWVDSDGGSSPGFLLSKPFTTAMTPAVAFDGTRFVVVYAADPPVDGGLTLWARQSLDDGGFSPDVEVGAGTYPALAFGDGGQGLLAYERFSNEPWSTDAGVVPEHASRVYVRAFTTPLSFPPPVDAGADAGADAGVAAGADAGASSDAGLPAGDAGPSRDGGVPSSDAGAQPSALAVGCGCGASGVGAWLLVGVASLLRLRYRPRGISRWMCGAVQAELPPPRSSMTL